MQQEIEQERQLNRIDDTSGDTNPYKELIVRQCRKDKTIVDTNGAVVNPKQYMLNYIQYDRHPKNYHSLGSSAVNK